MAYQVIYLDEARQDIREAKAWYRAQREGLQKYFAREVIQAIERLKQTPTAYAIRYKNFRVIHTRTFPYGIHFYINDLLEQIVITAIISDYRDIEHIKIRG